MQCILQPSLFSSLRYLYQFLQTREQVLSSGSSRKANTAWKVMRVRIDLLITDCDYLKYMVWELGGLNDHDVCVMSPQLVQ